MSDEKKKPLHPETNFLPPLDMVLTFFNKRFRNREQQKVNEEQEMNEKNVEKLIEKLSEKEE
ncbi:MAG TPA: hypothetical protein VLA72_14200 [Anaerolineales bacterium]|nr:hypothetical protein [Anaerolineales bacterium]